jgi:hypothetical protein
MPMQMVYRFQGYSVWDIGSIGDVEEVEFAGAFLRLFFCL